MKPGTKTATIWGVIDFWGRKRTNLGAAAPELRGYVSELNLYKNTNSVVLTFRLVQTSADANVLRSHTTQLDWQARCRLLRGSAYVLNYCKFLQSEYC